eukprot:CAMPEP_0169211050 /NCGR_PEP_ID=MMETSP1016-20121227/15541_1 /TAXON_ID=342587 /ORGANISM="Karlodinium micrum, Strain CCMP2283" /LENGTH=237 /DNA_ID=CAMNT_0009288631 /DNA_START=13 /DNA_END=724 /DNA_ORIENTATION=-
MAARIHVSAVGFCKMDLGTKPSAKIFTTFRFEAYDTPLFAEGYKVQHTTDTPFANEMLLGAAVDFTYSEGLGFPYASSPSGISADMTGGRPRMDVRYDPRDPPLVRYAGKRQSRFGHMGLRFQDSHRRDQPGIMVIGVEPNSAGAAAGFHVGDHIVEVNRMPIGYHPAQDSALMQSAEESFHGGTPLAFTVLRNHMRHNLTLAPLQMHHRPHGLSPEWGQSNTQEPFQDILYWWYRR